MAVLDLEAVSCTLVQIIEPSRSYTHTRALLDQHRRIARRSARPPSHIERFVQTKWGDYFTVRGSRTS